MMNKNNPEHSLFPALLAACQCAKAQGDDPLDSTMDPLTAQGRDHSGD